MRRAVLSHPLPVFGLVSRYLTNNLIGRSPLLRRQAFDLATTSGITQSFPWLSPTSRHVGTYYSPFRRSTLRLAADFALDLHVLAMPPAFNLSQDQTLQLFIVASAPPFGGRFAAI